jgi:thymidylate synthase (FAD)
MANMCVEINTTRSISAQFIRHRSIAIQEFSQRYSDTTKLGSPVMPHLRRQDTKNRQNSIDDLDAEQVQGFYRRIATQFEEAEHLYQEMISYGVAKECAREVLPMASPTRIYANGNIRSWITYIALREKSGTQMEHMKIAKDIKKIFCGQLPNIAEALGGEDTPWEL